VDWDEEDERGYIIPLYRHRLTWSRPYADVVHRGGIVRIYDDNPKPDLPRRPVGFAPPKVTEEEDKS